MLFLLRVMPRSLRRIVIPYLPVLQQFLRFGVVGVTGFLVDTTTVYGLRGMVGLYWAGAIAYLTASTSNWLLNRWWTFRGRNSGRAHHQWMRYLLANLIGFVVNRGVYALLVTFVPLAAAQPVIAIAAGSIAGMFINFDLSRRLVFRLSPG